MQVWLAVAALVIVGCSSSGTDPVTGAPSTAAATKAPSDGAPTTSVPPTPTSPVATLEVLDLPPLATVSFGGVIFELLSAETSNENPVSRSQGLGLPSASRYLYVEIGVDNPMQFATLTLNERTFLSMRTERTDLTTELRSNDISPASIVRPDTTGSYTAFFEIPTDFTPRRASLVFGEPGSHQIVLALADTGQDTSPAPDFPRFGVIDLEGEVTGSPLCGPSRLHAAIAAVLVSLDLPADVRRAGGLPRRADLGSVFVELTLDFEVLEPGSDGGTCVSTVVSDDLVALSSEDRDIVDHYVEGSNDVEAFRGDAARVVVGYMVPMGAELTITLGNPDGQIIATDFGIADL
jgi:hypothetical protein